MNVSCTNERLVSSPGENTQHRTLSQVKSRVFQWESSGHKQFEVYTLLLVQHVILLKYKINFLMSRHLYFYFHCAA